ncbi:hypothetical protein X777_09823 [Ooceraea biroi]|uniref:Uncharacterized protein n=1 Tax=Ooceraea biroi TaxID=2015173 RepID=A0A026W8X5_OOCBI|nr:hypothetical protein X777_09823 [Ooceraea biroi]
MVYVMRVDAEGVLDGRQTSRWATTLRRCYIADSVEGLNSRQPGLDRAEVAMLG